MTEATNLTNHFLIAMPALQDKNFHHTVTYICEHNAQGAMGIVINRPLNIGLGDILEQMDIQAQTPQSQGQMVFAGGPVQTERGFVLHTHGGKDWGSTLQITPQIGVTTSRDILEAIAANAGPQQSLIALGYAGWGSGQLEAELSANAWLSGPADMQIIFKLPVEQRWQAAAHLLGVDLNLLSGEAGHA